MPNVSIRYKGLSTRVTISPNQTLMEALSKFCTQKRLSPKDYALKHRNHGFVSLNTPFRLGKVDNNASLDLVPKPKGSVSRKPVRVAVQTPDRKRVQGVFPPTHTLYDILLALDAEHGTNILGREAENGNYLAPVVTMAATRRNFEAKVLSSTSLGTLGVQGSALLRVTLKEAAGITLSTSSLLFQTKKTKAETPSVSKEKKAVSSGVAPKSAGMKKPQKASSSEEANMLIEEPPQKSISKEEEANLPTVVGDDDSKTDKNAAISAGDIATAMMRAATEKRKEPLQISNVIKAFEQLKKEAKGSDELVASMQCIRFIVHKILTNKNEKFRSLKLSSRKLHSVLGKYEKSANSVLGALGFLKSRKTDGVYHVLPDDREDKDFLNEAMNILKEELLLASSSPSSSMPPSAPSSTAKSESQDGRAGDMEQEQVNGKEPVSMILDNEPEKFDWEAEKDAEKKKKEDEKKQQKLQEQTNLLERNKHEMEELSFDWEKNKEEKGGGGGGGGGEENKAERARTDIMQPEYNVSDVRRAMEKLRAHCGADAKACLRTIVLLQKITQKLQERPKKPQFRKLKLSSAAIQKKVVSKPGALDYLAFLGFEEPATQKGFLVLPAEKELDRKTSRALTMLARIYKEIEPEVPLLTTEQRKFRVFNGDKVDERSLAMLPQAKTKSDAQLVSESFREAKLRKALEGKILERQKLKRRYDRTIIRVVLRPEGTVLQAYFHPDERVLQVFEMIIKSLKDPRYAAGLSLRIPPTIEIKFTRDRMKTLDEMGLVPAATVNCFVKGAANSSSVLKEDVNALREAVLVAEPVPKPINEAEIQKAINDLVGPDPKAKGARRSKPKKKVPKWMRLQQQYGEQ